MSMTAGPPNGQGTSLLWATDLMKTYVMGVGETENIVHALDGVSLKINAGEMVAIRGPSGSGKSTLMNILGCLDRPTGGKYVLAGEDVSRMSGDDLARVRNRRIGFIFQTFNLMPRMSAIENVELPLLYGGAANAKKKAQEALAIVGLGDRGHHRPNQLSGGQRQRVAIARAIVTNPAILLADEPTGALDTRTGEEILALFKSLNAQGRTVIIVTHDLKVAEHCQREIFIRDGKISASEARNAQAPIPAAKPDAVAQAAASPFEPIAKGSRPGTKKMYVAFILLCTGVFAGGVIGFLCNLAALSLFVWGLVQFIRNRPDKV